ncbi:MAG: hypothetical protein NTW44_07090 [Nitrospirae bacterium]|nr:hypothetical protein [Nitrospirota bacterium]
MKKALQNIKPSTLDSLRSSFHNIQTSKDADDLLVHLCGINDFFGSEHDFLFFLELLEPCHIVSEDLERREFGDFQTPSILSDLVCNILLKENLIPETVVEPTFGKGSFIMSALKAFPKLKQVYGVEIYEPYCWFTKFAILELFIENPHLNKPSIFLYCKDIFGFDFSRIGKAAEKEKVLVLGNPPWVTNSELSTLNSSNLPVKSNFKSHNGFDAITGKGNFDIGEYIILMMLNSFAKQSGYMAMLAKNSVIKNLIYDLPKTTYDIYDMAALKFDAKTYFKASVEASLFKCRFGRNSLQYICKASFLNSPNLVESEFGWIGHKFVSDVALYQNSRDFDGTCPFIWRQGIKHDCSKILELKMEDGKFINGFNEELILEDDLIYGLVKSSDIQSPLITKPRKYTILTQKKIGEDTKYISEKFPHIYGYLSKNIQFFSERRSSIYKGKPLFSIFGIGEYSFKPYKVAISGLYKKPSFSLVMPFNNKPMMLDDTCYFLGFDDISEALIAVAILNSSYAQDLLRAITFTDAKRPYTKDMLMRINFFKIADHLGFKDARKLLIHLPDDILQYVTGEKWNAFFATYRKDREKEYQGSFFETVPIQQHPAFTP